MFLETWQDPQADSFIGLTLSASVIHLLGWGTNHSVDHQQKSKLQSIISKKSKHHYINNYKHTEVTEAQIKRQTHCVIQLKQSVCRSPSSHSGRNQGVDRGFRFLWPVSLQFNDAACGTCKGIHLLGNPVAQTLVHWTL